MSGSTFVAVDGAEFVFETHRAAKIALLLCSATSFSAIVFLVRAGVCWTEFERGEVVLLSSTGMAWTTWSVTCLVTIYARSLPPTQTWLWEATKRIMTYYSILWFATFGLCLTLTSRTFYPALACELAEPSCDPVEHRIAIEIFASSAISLLVAIITSILLSFELHSHRWLGIEPTPRPLDEIWAGRPLLGSRESRPQRSRKTQRLPADPIWDYSDQSASEDNSSLRPLYAPLFPSSSSLPPSYFVRSRKPLAASSLSADVPFPPDPFIPSASASRSLSGSGPPDMGTFFSPGKHRKHPRRKHGHNRSGERHHHRHEEEPSTDNSTTSTGSSSSSDTSEEERERERKAHRKKMKRKLRAKQEAQTSAMLNAGATAGAPTDAGNGTL